MKKHRAWRKAQHDKKPRSREVAKRNKTDAELLAMITNLDAKRNTYEAKQRAKIKAAGLCISCRKVPAKSRCVECNKKRSEKRRAQRIDDCKNKRKAATAKTKGTGT
jgi:hypothetical protein